MVSFALEKTISPAAIISYLRTNTKELNLLCRLRPYGLSSIHVGKTLWV